MLISDSKLGRPRRAERLLVTAAGKPSVIPVTEESLGAKFKGASADVADRIAKRLALDYRKARAASAGGKPSP